MNSTKDKLEHILNEIEDLTPAARRAYVTMLIQENWEAWCIKRYCPVRMSYLWAAVYAANFIAIGALISAFIIKHSA